MKGFRDIEKIITGLRKEYHFGSLDRKDLAEDPYEQFGKWFLEAVGKKDPNLNVMTLATAAKDAKPSARCVLLKGFDERGFFFYTDSRSRKGKEILANPCGAAAFFWPSLERQVLLRGVMERLPDEEADLYFKSRPREAQLAAWCSDQSEPIESREKLEEKFREAEKKFQGKEIPRKTDWCGYSLKPEEFEFWQGRENRLNDRFRYSLRAGAWHLTRLQP